MNWWHARQAIEHTQRRHIRLRTKRIGERRLLPGMPTTGRNPQAILARIIRSLFHH